MKKKYVLLMVTLLYIAISVWLLIDGITPKAGPVGNDINHDRIWREFFLSLVPALLLIGLTTFSFINKKPNDNQKNSKLRMAWIFLNGFIYLMFFIFASVVLSKADELMQYTPYLLSMWIIILMMLLGISIFGSYKIYTWIKEEKI